MNQPIAPSQESNRGRSMPPGIDWRAPVRETFVIGGFGALFWFCSAAYSVSIFNGLATPLFAALSGYLLLLSQLYRVSARRLTILTFSIFVAWATLADSLSGQGFAATAKDTHWFLLPIASLLFAEVFKDRPIALQVLRVLCALCILRLLAIMVEYSEWNDNWYHPPIFGHIRHLGLSIGFMSVLLACERDPEGWAAIFLRVVRVLGIALVFWSGSRTSMLGWIASLVVFGALVPGHAKILLVDTASGILLSLIPDPPLHNEGFIGTMRRSMMAESADALSSSRMAIWASAIAGLEKINRLWIGVGGNGFARLQTLFGIRLAFPGHIQAHSVLVQSICDWGIIGALALSLFALQSIGRQIFERFRNCEPTAAAGIAYLLVTGMLEATLYHLEHLIYLAISIGLLLARKQPAHTESVPLPRALIVIALLAMICIHALSLDYRIGLFWYFPTS